jgi:outer membrane protein OmpA-like peptidoglycan-associated protein
MKKLAAATLAAALLAAGCATQQQQTSQRIPAVDSPVSVAGCPLAPERPVNNTKKAIGTGVGAIGGALVGSAIGGRNSALVGAGLGGLFGYLVGSEIAVREQADGSVMLDIPGAALFDTNKTNIKPKFASTLDQISATLRDNPGTIVCVIGYTDATGSDEYNQKLSVERAQAVSTFLEAKGVSSDRLTSAGLGERFPVGSNDNEAGRTQNRRVEMYVRR